MNWVVPTTMWAILCTRYAPDNELSASFYLEHIKDIDVTGGTQVHVGLRDPAVGSYLALALAVNYRELSTVSDLKHGQ